MWLPGGTGETDPDGGPSTLRTWPTSSSLHRCSLSLGSRRSLRLYPASLLLPRQRQYRVRYRVNNIFVGGYGGLRLVASPACVLPSPPTPLLSVVPVGHYVCGLQTLVLSLPSTSLRQPGIFNGFSVGRGEDYDGCPTPRLPATHATTRSRVARYIQHLDAFSCEAGF